MRAFILFSLLLVGTLAAETTITVLGQIGQEIEKLDNKLVKELLEKKVNETWALKDEKKKLSELKNILAEVKKLTAGKSNKAEEKKAAADIVTNKEIALCNYLVQQACIMEALDGRGVGVVRNELTGNFNDSGLSKESKRLLRRLIALCDEAERGYKNVTYVETDGSEAKADLLTTNLSAGVGISLVMGDVTPLIASAVRIGRGYSNINKTKSRQLQLLIQSHQARITNFLFNVNSRKNDLIAEHSLDARRFITPDSYRVFLKALIEEDFLKRKSKLESIVKDYPHFTAALYYLAEANFEAKNLELSSSLFSLVIKGKNPLLRKDGFTGQSYTYLSDVALQSQKYVDGIKYASLALEENDKNARAYSLLSKNEFYSDKLKDSWDNALKAHENDEENAVYCWELCKIAAVTDDKPLNWLEKAIAKGFRDFSAVRQWEPLKESLETTKGKLLLTPKVYGFYRPGVFKDDIVLVNKSNFVLDNFKFFVKVRYFKKDQWHTLNFNNTLKTFDKDAKVEFKNKFSMSKKSKCEIHITFSSAQNPEDISTVVLYNSKGKKEHKFQWEADVDKAWQEILSSNDELTIKAAMEKLKEVADSGLQENSHIISGIAHALHKLGRKEEAIKVQEKAISILKEKLPDKLYDITVIPYEKALEKFKELKGEK